METPNFNLYRRAHESIAQGSLTNSKRVECMIKGVTPTHVIRGQGAFLFDAQGKKYIDYICALGTNLFGYANPHILKAMTEVMGDGWLYSMGSRAEIETAETLKNYLPFVGKVRFLKTGTEACMCSLRIARAHTGRTKVLSSGYHGHADPFLSLTKPALGVPEDENIENFTDMAQINESVAALILEPILTEDSPKRREWLNLVVTKCRKNGVLVIFDEIITGFRWPRLTFASDSGIHPDIILLGKAAASGMPLSIIGLGPGIGENAEWFISGTYYGECISLSILRKVLWLLDNRYKIGDLWRDGSYFLEEFNAIYPEKIQIEGYPTRGVFTGDAEVRALFWQESAKAGVLFGPSWFYGFQHMEHRVSVMSFCRDILSRIKAGQVKLEGEMPQTPFAQKVRSNG